MRRRVLLGQMLLAGGAAIGGVRPAAAQPANSIRIVVPFPPGGTTDVFARLFASRLGRETGRAVIVDNRGGAGGLMGGTEVHRATPDGTTLIFHSPTSGIAGPMARRIRPYDPMKGFEPVSVLGFTPMVLSVNPKLGITTLPQLVALLKREPGRHSFGSSGIGGVPHLTAELLKLRTGGLEVTHVPYRGAAGAIQDTMAGNLTFVIDTFAPLLQLHQSGQLPAICVLGEERAPVASEVRTAREDGIDVVTRNTNWLAAPPETPATVLTALARSSAAVMADPGMKAELAKFAYEAVVQPDPAQARLFLQSETELWGSIIHATGIELE
ncbi:Bug family tripartite tricarboxylate transporter substrate binding protein [Roseomonas chloroacetimidivorans]|uniref:Bug family tripartite tricarboxylate transporter substrate binding protein n=1 Tax=Roseomonas chloroacetimidivorans TaxID=1766656 RepID=UPI003C72E276